MEYNEYILVGIGTAISVIGYFLKKESKQLQELKEEISGLQITLAKNGVRDSERWTSTNKRLEDRRVDVRKLYDLVQKN
jgi:hypothetical protein|tara:strand:+ start:818 stop:1054 length:237 start_codon:yes stop_codon:yes gene_type:complete